MTVNNLNDHIAWLLSAKPFIPSVTDLPYPANDAPASSSTLQPESPGATSNSFSSNATNKPIVAPYAAREVESEPVDITSETLGQRQPGAVTHDSSDMARLRSVPSSATKPRLVQEGVVYYPDIPTNDTLRGYRFERNNQGIHPFY